MDSIARAPKMNSAGAYGHTSAGNWGYGMVKVMAWL
jgi:hypothetical protein